jgi:hypothetical protein
MLYTNLMSDMILQNATHTLERQFSRRSRTRFLWLYGPAGPGKLAIEQTVAELCYQMNVLAAIFFFSRGSVNGRNRKTFLITIIVYQLFVSVPEIRNFLSPRDLQDLFGR